MTDMNGEYHLFVLWNRALSARERILADIAARFRVVAQAQATWPCDAESGFRVFYGVKLPSARGKLAEAGDGEFLVVIVEDTAPAYGCRETSRGMERVNVGMFDAKQRYRDWTGGGHKVHATNSEAETRRDIYLLTGHTLDEWKIAPCEAKPVVRAVVDWPSLRGLFACLNETVKYVVLRNDESLPDAFDPALHGDIDLLVENETEVAQILGARKVYPEPGRVHYAVTVAGREIRFDLRHLGDGYYDERWEREILANRRLVRGAFYAPSPEDALYALAYHAFYQKMFFADDYPGKILRAAANCGAELARLDDLPEALERFLASRHYVHTTPDDASVYRNPLNHTWRSRQEELRALFGLDDVRPYRVSGWATNKLSNQYFTALLDGRRVFVKYSARSWPILRSEYEMTARMHARLPESTLSPLSWHADRSGEGGFLVLEYCEGIPLSEILGGTPPADVDFTSIARGIVRCIAALAECKIVHRDIRPVNFLLAADQSLKLIDFEFACSFPQPVPTNEAFSWCRDGVLAVLGGEFRAAPDLWNDAVSAGKVVELLPPFASRGETLTELARIAARGCQIRFVPAPKKKRSRWVRFRNAILGRKKNRCPGES